MKTRYEHIHFMKTEQKGKTAVWACQNNRSVVKIGEVRWYVAWRQYCYFAEPSIYSAGCLTDIIDFVNQVNAERKIKRELEKNGVQKNKTTHYTGH